MAGSHVGKLHQNEVLLKGGDPLPYSQWLVLQPSYSQTVWQTLFLFSYEGGELIHSANLVELSNVQNKVLLEFWS